ncbi:hypothetical protein D3C81_1777510 [compost metagenome]
MFLHTHNQVVSSNSCIINKNIYASPNVNDTFNHSFELFAISDMALHSICFDSEIFNFGHDAGCCLLVAGIVYSYIGSRFCQS